MLRLLWWFAVITAFIAACQATRSYYQCNNYMCNRIDQIFKSSLDRSINPCDDFRMHTCGSSNTTTSIASILDGLRGLDTSQNQETNIFRSILDTSLATNNPNENVIDSLKIERQIFSNCFLYGMRKDSDKEEYYESLPENAKKLERGSGSEETTERWINSDINYAYKGYNFAFFDFKITERTGEHNRWKKRYIQISPPTDSILDISSLFAKRYDSQDIQKYPRETLLAHKKLKNFLEELNWVILKKSDRENAMNLDQPQLLSEWQNKWDNRVRGHISAKIDWEKLIWQYFAAVGVKAPKSDAYIIVNEENYFFNLIKLLSSTSVQTIENYVHLRYISKTIGLVDEDYIEYSVIPSISKLVCTPGLLVGTAHAYATKYFPKSNRDKLKEILQAVRANIRNYVMRSIGYDWEAAPESIKSFLNKLESADVIYGYPSWLLDENLVANFYPDRMVVSERYFENVEAVYKSVLEHNLKAYNDYNLPVIDINQLFKVFETKEIEIFEKNTNEIVIPVHVFSEANFPFFSSSLYDSMNYGSVAATLASEIYIKYLGSVEDFDDITDCVNKQLPWSLTKAEGIVYKRKATAYLMGLLTAYEVWWSKDDYKNSLIRFNESGTISNSHLFFLSFAKTVCKSKGGQSVDLNTDIQPSQYINLVVSNTKEFHEAFTCEDIHKNKQKCNPLKH